jgi:hypothetical protein
MRRGENRMKKIYKRYYFVVAIVFFTIGTINVNAGNVRISNSMDVEKISEYENEFLDEDEIKTILMDLDYNEVTLEGIIKKHWNAELSDVYEKDRISIIEEYIDILRAFKQNDRDEIEEAAEEMADELSDIMEHNKEESKEYKHMDIRNSDFDEYLKTLKYCEKMILEKDLKEARVLFEKVKMYNLNDNEVKMSVEDKIEKWSAVVKLSELCVESLDKYMKNYNMSVNELSKNQKKVALKLYSELLNIENEEDNWTAEGEIKIRKKKIEFLENIGFSMENGRPENQMKSFVEILESVCSGSLKEFNQFDSHSKDNVYRYYDYVVEVLEKGLWHWIADDCEELKDAYEEGVDRFESYKNFENEFVEKQLNVISQERTDELRDIYEEMHEISKEISELRNRKNDLTDDLYELLEN